MSQGFAVPNLAYGPGYLPGASIYYIADNNFVKANYANLRAVIVEVVGAGGAGGGAPASTAGNTSYGLPGGGGGYTKAFIAVGDLATSETVTVGTGGTGVSGSAGNGGETSSFGSHCSATGGGGGNTASAATSTSPRTVLNTSGFGTGAGGSLNLSGRNGDDLIHTSGGSGGTVGHGGPSFYGHGPDMVIEANGATAQGYAPGAGGGGMRNSGDQVARTGGAGANGIVIVTPLY